MRIGILRIARRREENLIEIGVIGGPKLIAPGAVEGLNVAVLVAQPTPESGMGGVGLIERIAVFVVDLPADDRRMISETIGHGLHDAPRGLVEFGAERVVMPPSAEAPDDAAFIQRQGLRKRLAEPDRRRGRRGAEDHLQLALLGQVQTISQPVKAKFAGSGLEVEPRELGHVNDLKPHRGDVVEIPLPLLARPLLGIVIGSDFHPADNSFAYGSDTNADGLKRKGRGCSLPPLARPAADGH